MDRWNRQLVGPFTVRHIVALLASLAGVAVLLAVLTTPLSPAATPPPAPGATFVVVGDPTEGLAIGQRAPELEGTRDGQVVSVLDIEGAPVRLADLRGGPVWVNFWASWCPPCQEELPVLRTVDRAYRERGLSIVGVSVQESSAENVMAYLAPYDIEHTIGFDRDGEVFRAWLAFGLPTHYFLDAEGIIRERWFGPLSLEQATTIVEELLADQAASPSGSPAASAAPVASMSPAPG